MAARVPAAYELVEGARRLGPLPYSALGPTAEPPMPPPVDLAAWTAAALDEIWDGEGRPDPFTYVDVGAGDGTRARELLRLGPECLSALRVVLVEEDSSLRERQAENLSIEAPALTLGPVAPSDDPDEGSRPLPGVGPLVTSLTDLPVLATASVAVVIGFGWLSRQPADRYMWQDGTWWEVRLGALGDDGDVLTEMSLPLDEARAATMDAVVSGHVDEARYASPVGAVAWLKSALATAETGWLLAVDRWTAKTEPIHGQARAIALDQLAAVRQPASGPVPAAESLEVVRWRLG